MKSCKPGVQAMVSNCVADMGNIHQEAMMPCLNVLQHFLLPTVARSGWALSCGKENDASFSNAKEISSSSQRNRKVDFLCIESMAIRGGAVSSRGVIPVSLL